MPSAVMEARTLIADIKKANVKPEGKERLLYVNKLQQKKIQTREATWLLRNPDFGLSPLVSPTQNSPRVEQGTYRQLNAGPIITRHIKAFTQKELDDLVSPDKRYRLNAKEHIVNELLDSERRINETMEFTAHCAIARGALRYVLNDGENRVDVNLTFPIKTATVGTTWGTDTTDIVTDMDTYLKQYINRAGKRPDSIRMTSLTWESIKKNTSVKNVFTSYIRTQGVKVKEIPIGMITPEIVAKALDWPPITIYDERTQVKYACVNNESAASNVVVELKSTWGINVGDTALGDYKIDANGIDDWDFEAVIGAVNPGVSITFTIPTGKSLTAGEFVAVKPTFFPEKRILFATDEFTENAFILPPFGIEYSGSEIESSKWYGPRMDIFNLGNEPGMGVARRNWHEFGFLLGNPNKLMSIQVIL